MFPIEYINNNKKFDNCIKELSKVNQFSFDLEFDHYRYSYGFNLCLIQVSIKDKCFIIDPLSKIELRPLFDLFEDEKILKIVHSSGEDLKLLNLLKCYPKNLFDTDIITKLLNYGQVSLSSLLKMKLDIDLNKKFQKSNWNKRPLLKEQLIYASNDVVYLFKLKDILEKEAKEKKVFDFALEEFNMLDHIVHEEENRDFLLKKEDADHLSDYNQFIFNELLKYQDSLAKKLNKPLHHLIEYNVLKDLVLGKIDLDNWEKTKGIIWRFKTEDFKNDLENKIKELVKIANKNNLSKKVKKKPILSKEKKLEKIKLRQENEKNKSEKFIPIKKEISNIYGENASKYILSERIIDKIIKKTYKISDIPQNYKKELIKSLSKKLNIDLSNYY